MICWLAFSTSLLTNSQSEWSFQKGNFLIIHLTLLNWPKGSSHFKYNSDKVLRVGGQEIEFLQKLFRRSKLFNVFVTNFQNCSGDRKGPRDPRESLFQGLMYNLT
jgi:hypothetical protein